MLLITCGLYLALITLLGFAAASILLRSESKSAIEIAGLSFALGCGLLSLLLFMGSLAGVKPNRSELLLIAAAGIVMRVLRPRGGFIRLIRPDRSAGLKSRSVSWTAWSILDLLASLLILFACANVAATSLTPGLADVDAYAIWMFKAKIVSAYPLRPIPSALLDPSLSYSHQDYPFSLPLLSAGMYAATATTDVQGEDKALLLPMYLSLIAIAYSTLRRMQRPAIAWTITGLLTATPIVVDHAGRGVAELPLLLFFTGAVTFLLRWMEQGRRAELVAAGLFAAFAAFTKNEGLAFMALLGITALLYSLVQWDRHRLADVGIAAAAALLFISPWLVYRTALPRTHEDYGGKLTQASILLQNVPRLSSVLPAFAAQFFNLQQEGLLWPLLALSAILGWQTFRRLPILALWGLLIAHLALYVVTLMVTPWDLQSLLPMTAPRLLMHASPTAALLIGLHLKPKQNHF